LKRIVETDIPRIGIRLNKNEEQETFVIDIELKTYLSVQLNAYSDMLNDRRDKLAVDMRMCLPKFYEISMLLLVL
jgi:hypothetical protein